MPFCPACLDRNNSIVHRFTSEDAAQHFVLREKDPNRHDALIACIRRLWRRNHCEIARCKACGFTYAWPYVAGDAEFYNLAYPTASYPSDRWEYHRTIQALSASGVGRVLEIGAGVGFFLDMLGVDPRDIVALEYNEKSCEILRAKGYTAIAGDIRDVDLEPVDTVFMFQVLEHLDRLNELVAKIARLNPRDVFISVPNPNFIAFNEAHGSLFDMPPNHIGRWTIKAFDATWGCHGFNVVETEIQPVDIYNLIRVDLTYRILRISQQRGTVANRIRSLPQGAARRCLELLLAVAYLPARIPIWLEAAECRSAIGSAAWVHLRGPRSH
jgi:SAM-dependent methyltransferase